MFKHRDTKSFIHHWLGMLFSRIITTGYEPEMRKRKLKTHNLNPAGMKIKKEMKENRFGKNNS